MLLDIGVLGRALVIVLGFLWCSVVLGRWRSDWAEFRSTQDAHARGSIAIIWALTALIAAAWIDCAIGTLRFVGL